MVTRLQAVHRSTAQRYISQIRQNVENQSIVRAAPVANTDFSAIAIPAKTASLDAGMH